MKNFYLAVWQFSCVLFLSLCLLAVASADDSVIQVGDSAPEYLGKDRDGDKFNTSDHQGKVIVISFWATWCKPCLQELPMLDAMQQQVGTDELVIVGVNFMDDRRMTRKLFQQWREPIITITEDKRGKIGKNIGVKALPFLLIVGRDGKIAYKKTGYAEEVLDDIIAAINAELLS